MALFSSLVEESGTGPEYGAIKHSSAHKVKWDPYGGSDPHASEIEMLKAELAETRGELNKARADICDLRRFQQQSHAAKNADILELHSSVKKMYAFHDTTAEILSELSHHLSAQKHDVHMLKMDSDEVLKFNLKATRVLQFLSHKDSTTKKLLASVKHDNHTITQTVNTLSLRIQSRTMGFGRYRVS